MNWEYIFNLCFLLLWLQSNNFEKAALGMYSFCWVELSCRVRSRRSLNSVAEKPERTPSCVFGVWWFTARLLSCCQGFSSSEMSRFLLCASPSPRCAPQHLQHRDPSGAVRTALICCANKSCRNLACGKLVCTYPNRIPFKRVKGAVIYAHVQEHLCVSFDFMRGPTVPDPLLVKDGTKCGPAEVRNGARASGNGI